MSPSRPDTVSRLLPGQAADSVADELGRDDQTQDVMMTALWALVQSFSPASSFSDHSPMEK